MTSVASFSTTLVGDGSNNKQLQSSNWAAKFTASAPTTF